MKSVLLIMLLAAAATAQLLGKKVPDVIELVKKADGDEMPNVVELLEVADGKVLPELPLEVNEIPEVFVTDEDELIDVGELTDKADVLAQTTVDTRRNLNVGSTSGATLIYNSVIRANGVANHYHVRQITVRTNGRVRAVRVNRVGNSQGATPSIVGGGIGSSFVTIRIRSATGRGYHYRVQVYAR